MCRPVAVLSISLGWWTVSIYFMTAHVPPLKQCWHTNRLNALLATARYHTMDWSNHFFFSFFISLRLPISVSNKHSSAFGFFFFLGCVTCFPFSYFSFLNQFVIFLSTCLARKPLCLSTLHAAMVEIVKGYRGRHLGFILVSFFVFSFVSWPGKNKTTSHK